MSSNHPPIFGMKEDELALLLRYLGGTAFPVQYTGQDSLIEDEIKNEIHPDIRPPFLISYASRLKPMTKNLQQLFSNYGLEINRKKSKYYGSWVNVVHGEI